MTVHEFPHDGAVPDDKHPIRQGLRLWPVQLTGHMSDQVVKAVMAITDDRLRKEDDTWETVAYEVSNIPLAVPDTMEIVFATYLTVGVEDGEQFMFVSHRLESPWVPDDEVAEAVRLMVVALLDLRDKQHAGEPQEPAEEPAEVPEEPPAPRLGTDEVEREH